MIVVVSPHAPKIRPNHPRLLHRRHQRKFILSRLWSQNTNKPPSIVVVVEKLPSLHYTSWQTLLWCSSSRQVVIVWRYSTTNQQPDFGQHEIFNTSLGVSDTWIAQLLCIISTISRPIRLGSCCVSITHLLYVLPSICQCWRRSWVYSYYRSCWGYKQQQQQYTTTIWRQYIITSDTRIQWSTTFTNYAGCYTWLFICE